MKKTWWKEPDLNWENPRLRQAIYEMMHWWLKKGVDGFRMDVINLISKVPGLPDAPVTSDGRYQFGPQYFANGPRLLEFLHEMKRKVLAKYDILTVGETPFVSTQHGLDITHEENGALNMLFQFEHMDLDSGQDSATGQRMLKPWHLSELKQVMTRWQKDLENGGWNRIYLNFTAGNPLFLLPRELSFKHKELLITNYESIPAEEINQVTLRPFEARVYRLW